jgi:broad specificity phosphatase PhoE
MKLILLRHGDRGVNPGFFSELTESGIMQSLFLPEKLKDYKIDAIFSSPFLRTLQTIYPYAKKYNKKINIEYGLYEYLHNPYFMIYPWYYKINDIKDNELKSIVNNEYESIVNLDNFYVLEDEKHLEMRIIEFFSYLNTKYRNKTVLIVSHKGVINKIKDLYVKKTDMDDLFEMGEFEVYDI